MNTVQLTQEETLGMLEQLSQLPYHEVQATILELTKRLLAAKEADKDDELRSQLAGES